MTNPPVLTTEQYPPLQKQYRVKKQSYFVSVSIVIDMIHSCTEVDSR